MPTSLRDEIQQQAPFRSPQEEAALALQRTADRLRRELADLLKSHGLTPAQYNVLRILRGAGAPGHLIGEIGARLVVSDPDVPRLLDRLEKAGVVERRRQTTDRRCVRVVLTDAGRTLVDALDAPIAELTARQWAPLSPRTLKIVLHALDQLRAHD